MRSPALAFILVAEVAVAQTSVNPRARAIVRDGSTGAAKGAITLTETPGAGRLVDHRINLTGSLSGVPDGDYAVHLWDGSCDELSGHSDRSGQYHPLHSGDLPNVVAAGGVIRFNTFLSVTNRFTLTAGPLNLWGGEKEGLAVSLALTRGKADGVAPENALEADPDDEATGVAYCGEVLCDAGDCAQGTDH